MHEIAGKIAYEIFAIKNLRHEGQIFYQMYASAHEYIYFFKISSETEQ